VDTGNGWLLHAGDSYFFHRQLDPVKPQCPPGLAMFEARVQTVKQLRLDNQRRLRELVRDHAAEVTVFSAHDAVEFQRISRKSRV
jgi:hypothetical protein